MAELFWQALTTGLPGFLLGAGGIKILELCYAHRKQDVDDAALIRQELRLEVNHFKERADKFDIALNEWKDKYYNLLQKQTQIQIDLNTWQVMHNECKEQYDLLKEKYNQLHKEVVQLRQLVQELGLNRLHQESTNSSECLDSDG